MADDRRSPYLILGVPYGADRGEATRAFAQRSRRSRRDAAFPYSLEDLTWALHQIEANLDDPTVAIDYFRVPADPATLQRPKGPGILRPSPLPMRRSTEPASPASIELLRQQAVNETYTALLDRVAAAGEHHFVPARPEKPADITIPTTVRRRRRLWPWIVAFVLVVAAAAVVLVLLAADSGTGGSATTDLAPSAASRALLSTAVNDNPPAYEYTESVFGRQVGHRSMRSNAKEHRGAELDLAPSKR